MKLFLSKLILWAGDLLFFYTALVLALLVRGHGVSTEYIAYHIKVFSYLFPVWLAVNSVIGLYDFRQIRELPSLVACAISSFLVNLLISTLVFYFVPIESMTPKTHLLLTLTFSYISAVWLRRFWLYIVSSSLFVQRAAFLGQNILMQEIITDLKRHRYTRFKTVPFDFDSAMRAENQPLLGNSFDLLVVDGARIEQDAAFGGEVIAAATEEGLPVWIHSDFYEELYKKIPPELACKPAWLISHVLHRKREVYIWFKRLIDIFMSAAGLLAFLPLGIITAALIKISDGGDIFYTHDRIGYLQRRFKLWKFRTMRPGADREGYIWYVGKTDKRITPIGRFLRRYRIDELPQLWNIFKGDMSLVGPRPTWEKESAAFDLPGYNLRHLVKPGLTGWAQINYRATNDLEDTLEKLQYDFYYIKHISFPLDIAILLKTIRRLLQPEHHFKHANQQD